MFRSVQNFLKFGEGILDGFQEEVKDPEESRVILIKG